MAIKHEQDLRLIARQATEVAALIDQGGRHPGEFQGTVHNELPCHGPDVALQSIQTQLESLAAAIHTYLGQQAG
jgi:hypothetical protein